MPIVATDMLLLLHTPPVVSSVNVIEEPTHTVEVPDILPAFGRTGAAWVAEAAGVDKRAGRPLTRA